MSFFLLPLSRNWRSATGWLLLAALTAGCPKRGPRPGNPSQPTNVSTRVTAPVASELAARITVVQLSHKFVVIDFGSRLMPTTGTRREVYREGKRVGLVQIAGSVRGRFASADIVEGELEVGDEVR